MNCVGILEHLLLYAEKFAQEYGPLISARGENDPVTALSKDVRPVATQTLLVDCQTELAMRDADVDLGALIGFVHQHSQYWMQDRQKEDATASVAKESLIRTKKTDLS